MRCLLLYFTGTFNTRYVTNRLKERLQAEGWEVDTHEIDPSRKYRLDFSGYDLLGLGYPIHGYAAPWAFLRFVRHQRFPRGLRTFIYKNSGESETANNASSKYILRKLRRSGICVQNEYHFLMPYNIHFRFDERLVREILEMDEKLLSILVYEVLHGIPNFRRPGLWANFVCSVVSRPQYIAGDVDSFLYRTDPAKCTGCDLCVNSCPTHNISRDTQGRIRFGHHCLMCMRCSFFCPTAAIDIGFIQGWKVNGRYDFEKIMQMPVEGPWITPDTKGFFHCYVKSYRQINTRYAELFPAADSAAVGGGNSQAVGS